MFMSPDFHKHGHFCESFTLYFTVDMELLFFQFASQINANLTQTLLFRAKYKTLLLSVTTFNVMKDWPYRAYFWFFRIENMPVHILFKIFCDGIFLTIWSCPKGGKTAQNQFLKHWIINLEAVENNLKLHNDRRKRKTLEICSPNYCIS